MTKDNFNALMPLISSDLVTEISKRQNISCEEAMKKLYDSELYSMLEDENTKVWHYSTQMLYSLFEQEEKKKEIQFPDI